MCGIVGSLNLNSAHPPVEADVLLRMLAMIQHRGPDGFGVYHDAHVGLGSARLSIIDLNTGDQPIPNEDNTLWIVFNGEIFNYVELRPQLEARGHRFSTNTDTEVILHLYEEHGPACLSQLNGQWALAIWDAHQQSLFIARDRLGVRPLFYTLSGGRLVFGSEVKTLLAHPGVSAALDAQGLNQVFSYWSAQAPQTVFQGIHQLPPGHYLCAQQGNINVQPYWLVQFDEPDRATRGPSDEDRYAQELEHLLTDATRIRLRADVPVGAYLSGGLDSSLISALARGQVAERLQTFSIAFADAPSFDESAFQQEMATFLGTHHSVVTCTQADMAAAFLDVIWHAETPLLRTAPVPMFLLAQLVHQHQVKVVLTGEGADELLAGYDIFKEMAIRRFWAKQPDSKLRPQLLRRLYPDITSLSAVNSAYLQAFFKRDLTDTASPFYSHALRWANGARLRRFLLAQAEPAPVCLPEAFGDWSALARAQYLEMNTFLSPYLLSSQGDRMAMAHSVEGRYPFLDYRVVDFCNRLPANLKLSGLTEKWLLRRVAARHVPPRIGQRPKRPYRAPIQRVFFGSHAPGYVQELLSEPALQRSQLFQPAVVRQLVAKAQAAQQNNLALSEWEQMALVGVLSAQSLHHQFVENFRPVPFNPNTPVKNIHDTSNTSIRH